MTTVFSGKAGGLANAILAQHNIQVSGGNDSVNVPYQPGVSEQISIDGSEELGVNSGYNPIQMTRGGAQQLRFPPNFQEYPTLPKLKQHNDQVFKMVPDQQWFGEAWTRDQYANTPLNAYHQPQPPIDKPIPQRHHDMIEDEAKKEPKSQYQAGLTIDESCPIPGDGLTWDHRGVYANRPVHGNTTGRKVNSTFALQSASSKQIPSMTYGKYNHEAFYTHREADKRNLIATGILKNSWSGEQYEILEEQMPMPDTGRHSILPGQLKKISPKLVALLGGVNPHHAYRPKPELPAIVAADGGRNIFGQQLYADPLRSRLESVANQNVWTNRNGVYSTPISINPKEKPWGRVGLNPSMKLFAEMPATQRTDYESFNRPVSGPVLLTNRLEDRSKNFPKIEKKKCVRIGDSNNETTDRTCPFVSGIDAPMINVADRLDKISTQREFAQDPENSKSYNIDGEFKAGNLSADLNTGDIRLTMKMQEAAIEGTVTGENVGLIVSVDPNTIRDTLKSQMEQAPMIQNGELTMANQPHQLDMAESNKLRDTLKVALEEAPPVEYGSFQHGELPIMTETDLKPYYDLKEDAQPMMSVDNPGESVINGPVLLDSNTIRDTLKNSLPSTEPEGLITGSDVGLVNLTDNEVRETLKLAMELAPNPLTAAASDESLGQFTAGGFNTTDVRETYRNLQKKHSYTTAGPSNEQAGGICDAGTLKWTKKFEKDVNYINGLGKTTDGNSSVLPTAIPSNRIADHLRNSTSYNLGQGSLNSTLWDRVMPNNRCPTARGPSRSETNPILAAYAPVM
jgi:hypothetical protein